MWIPSALKSWLEVSREAYQATREENAALRAEIAALKADLTSTKINSDWFRLKINDLEAQNKVLLEKVYDIRVPVPQIMQARPVTAEANPFKIPNALFEHIEEEVAQSLGLDVSTT